MALLGDQIAATLECLEVYDTLNDNGKAVFGWHLWNHAFHTDPARFLPRMLHAYLVGVLQCNTHGRFHKLVPGAADVGRKLLAKYPHLKARHKPRHPIAPKARRKPPPRAVPVFPIQDLPESLTSSCVLAFLPFADVMAFRKAGRWASRMARKPGALHQVTVRHVDVFSDELNRRFSLPHLPLHATRYLEVKQLHGSLRLHRVPPELRLREGRHLRVLVVPRLHILRVEDVVGVHQLLSLEKLQLTQTPALEHSVEVRDELLAAGTSASPLLPTLKSLIVEQDELPLNRVGMWADVLSALLRGCHQGAAVHVRVLHATLVDCLPQGAPLVARLFAHHATPAALERVRNRIRRGLAIEQPVQGQLLHETLSLAVNSGPPRVAVSTALALGKIESALHRPLESALHRPLQPATWRAHSLTLTVQRPNAADTFAMSFADVCPGRIARTLKLLHKLADRVRIHWLSPTGDWWFPAGPAKKLHKEGTRLGLDITTQTSQRGSLLFKSREVL